MDIPAIKASFSAEYISIKDKRQLFINVYLKGLKLLLRRIQADV